MSHTPGGYFHRAVGRALAYLAVHTSGHGARKQDEGDHMRSAGLALVLALAFGIVSPAHAGTYSSPLLVAQTGEIAACYVSNVGTKPIDVTVTLFDNAGSVVTPTNNGCNVLGTLSPQQSCEVTKVGYAPVRCTVEASSSKVRTLMGIVESGKMRLGVPATKK
jgi:hypothetical protein